MENRSIVNDEKIKVVNENQFVILFGLNQEYKLRLAKITLKKNDCNVW